jgi:hypothetical protein
VVEPPSRGDAAGGVFDRTSRSKGRAELFIDRSMNYSTYAMLPSRYGFEWSKKPFRPVANQDGLYTPLLIETNRERVSRDGTVYPAKRLDWGRLSFGREPAPSTLGQDADSSYAYDPHSEWTLSESGRVIEIAIPWGLLNVGDPSSLSVLDDKPGTRDVETSRTRGIGFLAWATTAPGFSADSLGPTLPGARAALPEETFFLGPERTSQVVEGKEITVTTPEGASYVWNAWDKPITREHIKRSAMPIEQAFEGMEAREEPRQTERDAEKR